ncbi:MAG: hypothetical protein SCH71_04655 [Desulfobulbaceae bacterium]|nr:hypothetical protein [Desulfobulbaceae bacterium]
MYFFSNNSGMQGPSIIRRCPARFYAVGLALFTAAAFLFLLSCIFTDPAAAGSGTEQTEPKEIPGLPPEFGEVIYRINEKSPKQLYIIGISHRNPATRLNGSNTVQTQTEIFRIGEWLNCNMGLELLLPEGYFRESQRYLPDRAANGRPAAVAVNNLFLHKMLADETTFVNAEMLLVEHFDMQASQVEDRSIYHAVRNSLGKLQTNGLDRLTTDETIAELLYLQQIRTAMLLQNIPAVVEEELDNGTIRNSSAMFTIGLNHIHEIIRYFEENRILINAPSNAGNELGEYRDDINLLKKGYGITIIIPRVLADNRGLLQKTNLDRMLLAEGSMPVNQ